MFICFDRTHERDRQTDGRTDRCRMPAYGKRKTRMTWLPDGKKISAYTALMHSIAVKMVN